ncbi:family 20 glycosylhydrolase [Basfia succiniciproducens]|uniref:Hexosaminidase n=1 Tax=Basfia succiniciproducens TaxID=653940 RepID=A0A1G5AC62_9PAST|nr:family 20 glycosylhydrolase [Basfia succiniciproducens]QIM68488.1 molecular chaperone TorD [Basfia succiniciproducens]SCX75466.1 hexosaminidase [Basfia succiniciproducens]
MIFSSCKTPNHFLCAIFIGFGLNIPQTYAETVTQQFQKAFSSAEVSEKKESGLALDIARHFYSAETIKNFIDTIHKNGGTFLHLHFSDHENYAIESTILGQRAENARRDERGFYVNPKTGKPFLTYEQLKDIMNYAKQKNVELIPELDSPNHMTAIFDLLAEKNGKDYVQKLRSKWTNEEIDITNPDSIAFMTSLIEEVVWIFGNSTKHFHIGGDEFGYSEENNHEFINYANKLSAFLKEKGLKTRIWNDGLIKSTIDQLDPNIQVTYWSYDGNTQNKQAAQQRRTMRISMPELIERGFSVLNYNSYYLYFNPKESPNISKDSDFAMRDVIKNWDLSIWDEKNTQNKVAEPNKISGSALAIWGEHAGSLKGDSIHKATENLLKAIIYKTNAAGDSTGIINRKLQQLDFAQINANSYIDLMQIKNNESVTLENYPQTVHLLQTNALSGKKRVLWVSGSHVHKMRLEPQWQKTGLNEKRNGKSYTAYKYQDNILWLDDNITEQ